MRHNYFNLNQIKSNPDGQPTVNRQSRLMSYRGYLKNLAMIFAVLVMSVANIGMAWGAASTSSDGKTASGTITFSEVGTLSQQTTYWYNGLKFYEQSTNSMSADKGKRWSAAINPCQYDTFTSGVNWQAGPYEMTGLILQAHCLAINVSSACTIEVIVNMSGKTLGGSNPVNPGNLKVFWDGTAYGTAYTSSTYKTGTAKIDTTWEQNINGKYNRMKLSIPVSAEDLAAKSIDVIKVSYTGSATGTPGYSQAFVYESVKIVPTGGGGCSAPTSPSISGTTAYTEGQDISLTASATGTDGSTTYTWYKGADWATASAGSSIGSAATFTKASCAVGDAGTYWCNISNGTGCEVQVSKTITVAEASCDAADLTASNITSNGDQDAGTGITFSKEGSPASGDTWYWQTSATGTDKSSNASSPYTTATTVGSYTVYLRAYNTAGDCWGTAASMTNTIYPAPSAMIHNTFAVNDAWSSTIATQDKTNITSLNAMAAVGESVGSGSNKSGLTQKIPSQSSEDASKYMSLSFNVASGKQLNVTSVVFDEQPVSKTGTFKVSISDNQGSATKTQTIASGADGSKHTLTLDGDIVGSFKGTVTVKVWAYGWGDGYRFGDYFYINGTVTAAAACTAPNHVDISGNYHFFPGETLTLTATAYSTEGTSNPISAGDITGYQWQKYIGSDWADIVGETSATYTKANATTSDVGQYRCIVSTGATCSTTSSTFNAKCLQLYVYWDNKSDKCNLPFTKVDGTHATVNVSLENGSYTYYYKVTDGCGNWWGNNGTMTSSNCSGWNLDVNNHCGLTTTKAAAYTFNLTYNAGVDAFSMSVVYPSTVQTGGYNLYFANDERNWSNIHYRIGRNNWNSKAAMTLVPGTANLYQTTTIHYQSDGGFEAWHIANNGGCSDGNSIYKTKTGDTYAITNATRFEGAPVPSTGLTVIPGSDHSTGGDAQNNNCEFYSYTSVPGMLTRNVSITAPSNGTLTVNYVDVSGAAQAFSSGNRDLAHTCIITVTAVPDAGYAEPATVSINGASHGNRDPYTITATTVVAATFSPQTYSITYKDEGNVAFSGEHIDTPSAHPTSHTYNTATNLNGATKTGYTFGGWYTNSACTGDAVTSLDATDYTANITLYAKWNVNSYTLTASATVSNPMTAESKTGAITGSFTNNPVTDITSGTTTSTLSNTFTVNKGTPVTVTAAATIAGTEAQCDECTYVFDSWENIPASVTADVSTIHAIYKTTYSISFKETDETDVAGISASSYDYGVGKAASTLPTPTKSGYTFGGWYNENTLTTPAADIDDDAWGNITYYAKWTAATSQTALVINTLYEVPDMIPSGATLTNDDQFFEGLSANTKFELIGSASSSWTPKVNSNSTNDKTIDGIPFDDGSMWFKGDAEPSSNIPTKFGLSFIVPEGGGKLYLYFSGESTNIKLAKSGSEGSKPTLTDGYGAVDVTAGTYYLYGTGTTAPYCFYGLKLCSTYSVTITPTNVTKETGATGAGAAIHGKAYTATFTANTGYTLPSDVAVSIGGTPATKGTEYTWSVSDGTGTLTVKAANVTGNIVVTVTGAAAATYALTYNCNGAESGCPSNTTASALPNPLPTGLTKDGYTFGGWFTDEGLTVSAEAGAAMTEATTLYAKWTVNSSSECITIAYFETTAHNNSSSKPDNAGKYIYGYTNSAKTEAYAYTITSSTGDNKGQGTGESDYLRMNYGTTVTIYADNTTTSGTPASFENVTGVSVDFKMKNSSYYTLFDIYVGDTKIADDVSLLGDAQTAFTTFAYEGLAQLSGTVRIVNKGSGSSNYHFYVDNIKICTAALPSCTTPVLSDLEDQKVCPGEDVSWTASNTEALQDGETIAYQWTKKGNATILSPTATLTLNDVTEATGGTYVVTAIVSADGKASKTASKEVTLTVTPATATPTITANANTIYTGNDVTLTATCASSGVGYQWYTCTDADGTNAQAIGGATNATYTLTAGEAGTYYYKVIVTGDDTHSCGTAEKVYALVVSASNSGETTCGDITGQFTNGAYTFDTDFIIYGINSGGNLDLGASSTQGNNRCGGNGSFLSRQRFAVTFPVDVLSFSFIGYQSNLRTVEAVKTTTDLKTADTEYTTITHTVEPSQEGNCQTHVITPETAIPANTFVWVELNNGLNLSEICYVPVSNVNCTDPQVIATVDNATVCEDTENVTFTATNYADGATLQWQKKNGNAWGNIGATSATYTISPVTTEHAGQYRVIATKEECSRTSEELTLTVLTAPEFNAFANTASVMKGNALTINDVEATNATSYAWYKSADATYDAGTDTKVGTTKELLLAASSITEEADQAFYLFCVASNSCGSVTSNAITVTVTPFVEEECATKGNEGEHEFGFDNEGCSSDTYGDTKTPVWKTNSRSKYLTYTAPEGKYFATAKVTVAHTGGTKCGYAYSTNRGATWVVTELEGLSATLTAITIELPANVNAFRISRNLTAQDGEKGSDSGNFYLAEACFTYENACTPTSVTPTTTSYEYNISTPADFEEPPFTVKHGEDIVNDAVLTYTSSNPAIATVDEDGSVTFEGMTGTVTITAAYAGTTIDEIEYCASEGSYTITVVCQDEEPKIIVAAGTNLDGCNNSITLEAKMQDGNSFTGGTFQWYRDGEAIDGATSASYEVVRAGTYTVSRTYTCTTMSSNPAVVTNENPEPKVERLTPFQYYHVDKDYSDQMKDRHLFAVTSYGTLDGKRYHLTATRNGDTLDLSSSTAFFTIPSSDNAVDTVMIDLNELKGKYNANDEIVITCAPIDNCNQVSTITSSITIHVIGQTPTLALICSGANGDGTRDTEKLVVGGDFLTGYNKADLCQQTGNKTFDPNTEWGFYEALQDSFIVTPVNGYAQFNKLNYEPFDILLLTDYPKSSKSEAAQKIIDDMAELCDYRPLLSFKTHFQSDKWKDKTTGEYKYTKWVKKGFTTAPVVPKQTATYVNIVCYAHPMFEGIDNINDEYTFHDDDDPNQLVYQVLTGPGYEGNKGIQGFELADADNFVTIGLVHYNAQANKVTHDDHTHISWSAEANDRLLVAMAERQTNIEARMMLFSLNCGAQSLQTEGGRRVILQCLKYLLETDPLEVADCRMTFDNGAGNTNWGKSAYEGTGTRGDGLWSTAANWGPDYLVVPGRNNDVRIAAPCIVDGVKTKVSVGNEVQETIQYYPEVLSIHITENGSLTIPANSSLTARSTILRADENGNVYPTNVADISLGSNEDGNASLILNNERGDTKAGVAMYSTAKADTDTYSAAASTWQYIGTPHSDVANAIYNYYDSWLYQYDTNTQGWAVIPNGGPLVPFRGYCVTHPERPHTYWMEGTLVSTTNQDISIPAERFVVVANSWTAPIQIKELTGDDMEGLRENTIYFFNTGSDPEGDNTLTANATGDARWAEGTYISVPIHSASYTGDSVIPSMQGFYVVGGNADGTLHLDYERHVRAKRENVPSGPMHAPARIADTDNEPQVAKFLFRGKRYDDRLIILERPDFTRGYDSGWDGEQWGGNAAAPMSYVVTETRWDAVSAIPEYEGTVIAFRAGEDSEYTIHFDYDGMEEALYLLDTETKIYTRVLKGNSYTFTCTDKAEHNRFILTRKAPQIATGVGNVSGDEVQGTKAKKLLIEDKMFIMVNGVLYDATGKVVK